jgi:Flp pilus assembly protein TadB
VSSLKTAFPLAVWGVTLNIVLYLEIRAYLYYKNLLQELPEFIAREMGKIYIAYGLPKP